MYQLLWIKEAQFDVDHAQEQIIVARRASDVGVECRHQDELNEATKSLNIALVIMKDTQAKLEDV